MPAIAWFSVMYCTYRPYNRISYCVHNVHTSIILIHRLVIISANTITARITRQHNSNDTQEATRSVSTKQNPNVKYASRFTITANEKPHTQYNHCNEES
jgi:hypothetical protein